MFQLETAKSFPFRHGFSTKADGNMSYLWGEFDTVYANRQKFATQFGVALEECVFMATNNSDRIEVVDESDKGRGVQSREDGVLCDALITNDKEITLCLLIADCMPIIIVDPIRKAFVLVHGSWQSTDLQIVAKTIASMQKNFGSEPKDLQVLFGPSITKKHHRFAEAVQSSLPAWQPFLATDPDGMIAIDVLGYNRHQLIESSVFPANIVESGIDVADDDRFFSHYRDSRQDPAKEGRFLCLVKIG